MHPISTFFLCVTAVLIALIVYIPSLFFYIFFFVVFLIVCLILVITIIFFKS